MTRSLSHLPLPALSRYILFRYVVSEQGSHFWNIHHIPALKALFVFAIYITASMHISTASGTRFQLQHSVNSIKLQLDSLGHKNSHLEIKE